MKHTASELDEALNVGAVLSAPRGMCSPPGRAVTAMVAGVLGATAEPIDATPRQAPLQGAIAPEERNIASSWPTTAE